MKILTKWLRSAVPDISVDDLQLAEDLTLRGIAVEGVHDLGVGADGHLFEMDITTNRVDAMCHHGISRARMAAPTVRMPCRPDRETTTTIAIMTRPDPNEMSAATNPSLRSLPS